MSKRSCTRRRALQLGGAGLIAGLAGCGSSGNGSGNGNGSGGTPALRSVPSGAAMVARVEVGTLLDGPVVKQAVEQTISVVSDQQPNYSGPKTYEAVLSMADEQLGVDPEGLQSMTTFLMPPKGPGEPPFGAVLDAEWSESAVVTALESKGGASLSKGSYNGATTYASAEDELLVAVLPDGRFVLGLDSAVKGVVDVVAGDADPVGGRVATAYGNAPSGPVRMGLDLTATRRSTTTAGALASVETVSGGMAVKGGKRRLVVAFEAADEESAAALGTLIQQGLSRAQSQAAQAGQMPQQFSDAFARLDEVEVATDGTTVTVSHTTSAGEAGVLGTMLAAVVASFFLGLGQRTGRTGPVASFEFEYDADAGAVTITHRSGDTIQGSELYVRGTTGNGTINRSWAEYGVSEVTAGRRVTVENVTGEYRLNVVWESSEGTTSRVLAADQGPDA